MPSWGSAPCADSACALGGGGDCEHRPPAGPAGRWRERGGRPPARPTLGQMRVVEAGVAALGEGPHLFLRLRAGGGRRPSAPVPVSHAGSSLLSIRRQQSPRVALAHPHQFGRLSHRHLPLDHAVQHLYPRLLSGGQRQSFHRLTFSLTTYPLTKSLNNDKGQRRALTVCPAGAKLPRAHVLLSRYRAIAPTAP